jgi:hypothetical protein
LPSKQQIKNAVANSRFTFGKGSEYLDKDKLVAKETIFTITAINFKERGGYLDTKSPRWRAGDVAPDAWEVEVDIQGDVGLISFGCNEKRDEMMSAAKADIDVNGPLPNCVLVRSGQAYYINNVDTEVLS